MELKSFFTNTVLLKILSEGDSYAYEITEQIKTLTNSAVTPITSTIYPALYRLEEEGYISSYKKKVGKRMERVYYHIEESGRQELEFLINVFNSIMNYRKDEDKNVDSNNIRRVK